MQLTWTGLVHAGLHRHSDNSSPFVTSKQAISHETWKQRKLHETIKGPNIHFIICGMVGGIYLVLKFCSSYKILIFPGQVADDLGVEELNIEGLGGSDFDSFLRISPLAFAQPYG